MYLAKPYSRAILIFYLLCGHVELASRRFCGAYSRACKEATIRTLSGWGRTRLNTPYNPLHKFIKYQNLSGVYVCGCVCTPALVGLAFIYFCFVFCSFKTISITKIFAKIIIACSRIKSTYNYFDRQCTMTPEWLPIEVLCAGHIENPTTHPCGNGLVAITHSRHKGEEHPQPPTSSVVHEF